MTARVVGTGSQGWDDQAKKDALDMFLNEGLSPGQISNALQGRGYDITRNAVIGFINREKNKAPKEDRGKFVRVLPEKIARTPPAPKVPRPPPEPKAAKVPALKHDPVIQLVKKIKPLPVIKEERLIEYIGPIEMTPGWGFCQYTRDDIQEPGWRMCGHPAASKSEGPGGTVFLAWCASHDRICHQASHVQRRGEDAA